MIPMWDVGHQATNTNTVSSMRNPISETRHASATHAQHSNPCSDRSYKEQWAIPLLIGEGCRAREFNGSLRARRTMFPSVVAGRHPPGSSFLQL
jgi:hypothetical protein